MKRSKSSKRELPFFLGDGYITVLSSLVCIILGLALGLIVLLCINPGGAFKALSAMLQNYLYYNNPSKVLYYFASTLVKTVPLIFCALSVLFAQKAGMFNIGVAGQYTVGAGIAIWCALYLQLPWYICVIAAALAGCIYAMLTGIFKAYKKVNEVISGIMLNWIGLYLVNMLLMPLKDPMSQYTMCLADNAASALLPSFGMKSIFGGNAFIGVGVFAAPVAAALALIILNKTKLGYELKATGFNSDAAFYCGMKEKKNIVITTAISGILAGIGAAMYYLTDIDQWFTSMASVPAMGFDGIAAAFLGGLHPIGVIFSSYFIKHITLGGTYIDKSLYSTQIVDLITAIIIYFCAFVQFFRVFAINAYKKHKLKSSVDKEA